MQPVVQLVHEPTGEVVYTRRLEGATFTAPVFDEGPHTLRVGTGEAGGWTELTGLEPAAEGAATRVVEFGED